ncbi:MAG: thrombospondin type 3 repeat-containing protein [Fibrobacter sp.]|nr:thrombospondin type 3 repeat-containing protein [Fibrobacter sp.]
MKRILFFLFAVALFCNQVGAALLAFPGAKGGGKYATGGRGGEVYHVTNLNDDGAGSFRDAVSKGPRIVVFDVGGTINLKKDVVIQGNITVAGQTAPGGAGITVAGGYKIGLGGSNNIVRFISSRPGERGTNADYDAWGGANGSNSILDHISIGWANDEQWGLYSNNNNQTVQYSIIGPSNSFSYHSKGIHGFAVMLGRASVSWDHNLIVHNVSRNFRGKIPGTEVADFTNNVIYNWGGETAYGTLGHLNYVGNTLKKGNGTTGGNHFMSIGDSGSGEENYLFYVSGNRFLNRDHTAYNNNFNTNNWNGMTYGRGLTEAAVRTDTPFTMKHPASGNENVSTVPTVEDAETAYNNVINYAGAAISAGKRNPVDKQVTEETKNGTGNMVGARPCSEANASQQSTISKHKIQCGTKFEYPGAFTRKEITDSDNDGMPDDWEIARGLNPNKDDSKGDYLGQGYMNIEYYANDLTVDAFPPGVVTLSPVKNVMSSSSAVLSSSSAVSSLNGILVKELQIHDTENHGDWSIQDSLTVGDLVHGDRGNTWLSLPPSMIDAEYIRTAADSKALTGNQATFEVNRDVEVSVLLDTRVVENEGYSLPAWLEGWTKTTETSAKASNEVSYYLYQKNFSSGSTVTLGTNGPTSGVINYVVAVKEAGTNSIAKPQYFMPSQAAPHYYSLKGEPLGTAKPKNAGVYLMKQGSSIKKIMVR